MSMRELPVSLLRHARLFRPDRQGQGSDWPPLQAQRSFRPDAGHLQRFLELCPGWNAPGYLPPTYPQVAAVDLHLRLLGDRGFPWHPVGLVHLSNSIEMHEPLPVDRTYQLGARLAPGGEHPRGVLTSIETTLHDGERLLWRSEAVALKMTSSGEESAKSTADATPLPAVRSVELPEDLGRRYARVAGDLNPIHQRAWMARPFGFRQHILHGMWTLAWSIQPLVAARSEFPVRIDARFLRPVFLPGSAHLGIREEGGAIHGQLWTNEPERPALSFEVK